MRTKYSLVNLLTVATAVFLITNLIVIVWTMRGSFFTFDYWQRYPELERKYNSSQYANPYVKESEWIDDETAFAYAGGALITGTNPINIVPDAPPIGKYIIGLSALLFHNENILIVLVFGLLDIVLLFIIGKRIFKSSLLALLPPLFFSLEPIYRNQFKDTPLFDHAQLFFLLLTFYLFNKVSERKTRVPLYFIFISISIGIFIGLKFFASGLTVVGAIGVILLIRKQWNRIILFISTLPISAAILLGSYAWVFRYGYTVREFLGIQKWIFIYHTGKNTLPFTVWPLLFANKWYTWWGDKAVISDSQWMITWPIIAALSFVTMGFYLFNKIRKNRDIEICMVWVILYMLFLSTGNVFTRYFLILLPVLYIISLYGIIEIYTKIFVSQKKKKK